MKIYSKILAALSLVLVLLALSGELFESISELTKLDVLPALAFILWLALGLLWPAYPYILVFFSESKILGGDYPKLRAVVATLICVCGVVYIYVSPYRGWSLFIVPIVQSFAIFDLIMAAAIIRRICDCRDYQPLNSKQAITSAFALVCVPLFLQQGSYWSGQLSKYLSYQQETERYRHINIVAEVQHSLGRGDLRAVAVMRYSLAVPGFPAGKESAEQIRRHEEKYGLRNIGGTDCIESDKHGELLDAQWAYAETYNRILLQEMASRSGAVRAKGDGEIPER